MIVNAPLCAILIPIFRSQQASGDTSVSSHTGLLIDPKAIASTRFFQQLTSQQRGQLLLQAARLHFLGDSSTPVDTTAVQLLHASADEHGNPDAQFLLGALLASNDHDAAQSVLYHHFAARGGSIASSMALGYRHLHGYGVPESCEASLRYYKFAADRVISTQSSLRPVQVFSSPAPFRLSDNNSKSQRPPAHAEEEMHRMEYLRQLARGSSDPALLEKAASVVLFSDLPIATLSSSSFAYEDPDDDQQQLVTARNLEAKALLDRAVNLGSFSAKALLAHVYAYGLEGFHQDVPQAIRLYEEALNESAIANATSAEAANGLGLIYFNGVGDTRVDYERAMRLFKVSARKGHADGVYNTGVLLSEAHPQRAQEYLEASAHVGHMKAQFKLARLKEKARFSAAGSQIGPSAGPCEDIVRLYKQVAENSREGIELLESAAAAFFFANDWQQALQLYLVAAEMGYEVAESNAAWLLERRQQFPWTGSTASQPTNERRLYEKLVQRGVAQDSPDAHVRYGDLLFAKANFALAMLQYELADYLSYGKHGRALFSMAFMHEKGLGVHSRSLEQARLYYELVASVEPTLYEVVWLIRLKLQVQAHIERLVVVVRTLVNQLCDLVGLQSLQHQANHELVASSIVTEQWHQTELSSTQLEYQGEQLAQAEAVTFASALRFTEDSKLQLEVLQSPAAPSSSSSSSQSVTVETWIKIQPESRSRTHMVLLDLQSAYTVEMTKAHTSSREDQWLLQFRTESVLFVFANGPLTAGEWYHIAIVVASTHTGDAETEPTIALFVNGELRQQFEFFPSRYHYQEPVSRSPPKILSVGSSLTRSSSSSSQSSQFTGSLVHFRMWKSVESSESIRSLQLTQQHQLGQQQQAELLVELHFQIQRLDADEKSNNGATPLERTPSDLQSNTRIYTAVSVEPGMVQFPPAQRN